jgi:hypothetical protein
LQRGADRLGEIAGDDDAVERGGQARTGELFVDEADFRLGLLHLRGRDQLLGAIALAHRLFEFELAPLALGDPFQPFEQEIAVVETGQQLAGLDGIAGTDRRFQHEAVEGRDHRALDRALDRGIGRDAVEPLPEIAEGDNCDQCQHRELARGIAGAEQADGLVPERFTYLDDQPAVVAALLFQMGAAAAAMQSSTATVPASKPLGCSKVMAPMNLSRENSGTVRMVAAPQTWASSAWARVMFSSSGGAGWRITARWSSASSMAAPTRRTRFICWPNCALCEIATTSAWPWRTMPMETRSQA